MPRNEDPRKSIPIKLKKMEQSLHNWGRGVLGTGFRTSGMLGKKSTTELHPRSALFIEYLSLQKDIRKGNVTFKKQKNKNY